MSVEVKKPAEAVLRDLDVYSWPVWEKDESRFDWSYDDRETFYVLTGKARVEPEGAEPVEFGAGDLVTIPKGIKCVWEIITPIKKHFKFG